MKRLFNKDVPFITYIIHDKNMKNGRTVTVYKPTQEYYILFELIKFRRLPSTFPDIGITVISEWSEPSPSDVSTTQDVLMDIKKDLSDAEIEELGAQEAERKEFCPNCEAETPCTHEAELFVCDICGEDFAKYIVSRNCNVSDVSMTERVLMIIKNRAVQAIEYALPIHEGINWYIDDSGIIGAVHQIEPVTTKERLAIITNVLANDVLHLIQQLESISKQLSTTEFHDNASKQSRDFWKNYALQVNSKMLMQIEFIRKLLSLGTVLNDRLKDEAISLLDDRLSSPIEEKGCKNDE